MRGSGSFRSFQALSKLVACVQNTFSRNIPTTLGGGFCVTRVPVRNEGPNVAYIHKLTELSPEET